MLLRALKEFSAIIGKVSVDRFERVADTYELKASIVLMDGSHLNIKDYLFADGTRKYAYHIIDRPPTGVSLEDGIMHLTGLALWARRIIATQQRMLSSHRFQWIFSRSFEK